MAGSRGGWVLETGGRRIALARGEVVLGRSRDCEIVLRDGSISRTHALLSVTAERVTVQDLDSANGTFVDGARVREETALAPGGQLRLGRLRMTLRRAEPAAAAAAADRCPACGAAVDDGAEACAACGEPLGGERPLSRSEAVAASEVLAVGEALATPSGALDETRPPYPVGWEDPATRSGAAARPAEDRAPDPGGRPGAAALPGGDDPAPAALAEAAETDAPTPAAEAALGTAGPAPPAAVASPAPGARLDPPRFLPAAGFWVRAVAFVVDAAAAAACGAVAGAAAAAARLPAPAVVGTAVAVLVWLLVSVVGWSRSGATPGKRLLGLRVCDLDGRPGIGTGRAVARWAAYLLSALPAGAGFLAVGLGAGRRGLHDVLAGTYVARLREGDGTIGRRR